MQKQYRTDNSFAERLADEEGNIYCRAVHGILSINMDQQVCGKGCPCYYCCDEKAGGGNTCGFYEQNTIKNAHVFWERMEQEIASGSLPLFPASKQLDNGLAKAYAYAANAHRGQFRKGTTVPYFTHIITTMNYAMQLTKDLEILEAAILHDTVEDTWVEVADIRREFGERVAAYVEAETENKRVGRPAKDTWEIRKQENVKHLQSACHEVKIIVLADKTANAESMLREWYRNGDSLWEKFNQSDKTKQAWYYYACADSLAEFSDTSVMKQYLGYLTELFGRRE